MTHEEIVSLNQKIYDSKDGVMLTVEDAIKILEDFNCDSFCGNCSYCPYENEINCNVTHVCVINEALNMAIDALKEKQKADKIKECFVDGFCAKRTFKKIGKLIAEERTNHGQK